MLFAGATSHPAEPSWSLIVASFALPYRERARKEVTYVLPPYQLAQRERTLGGAVQTSLPPEHRSFHAKSDGDARAGLFAAPRV